jgi:hypothetical protein
VTIEQCDKIDGMGIDRATGAAILVISDHLPWDDRHSSVLEAKLASYVRFIESGQIQEQLPSATQREIRLHMQYRPTGFGLRFLEAAKASLASKGILFSYGPLPTSGYIDDHS